MTRRRFFVPHALIHDQSASLPPDQAHHLRDVLRLRTGAEVEIFDGEGHSYTGVVRNTDEEVVIERLERITRVEPPALELILALALAKPGGFEWVLQKATELGVTEVVPLVTRYSQVRITGQKLDSRLTRWNRILREASRQCGRSAVPKLSAPRAFAEFASANPYDAKSFFLYEQGTKPLETEGSATRALLCVGPEGGWHSDEVELAERAGWRVFRLGPRVLRTETAAVAALAILQHRFGDLGKC